MTKFDPTTNRVSWKLLTKDEQETLINWPHGVTLYDVNKDKWFTPPFRVWLSTGVYRGKPALTNCTYYCNVYPKGIFASYFALSDCEEIEDGDKLGILKVDIINNVVTSTFIPKGKTK
jgi:hypothetical protein